MTRSAPGPRSTPRSPGTVPACRGSELPARTGTQRRWPQAIGRSQPASGERRRTMASSSSSSGPRPGAKTSSSGWPRSPPGGTSGPPDAACGGPPIPTTG